MNRPQKYTAIRLGWCCVSSHLSSLISEILNREVICETKQEDDNYWSAATIEGTFTSVEIATLIEAVGGGKELYVNSIPTDSNTSKSLAMDLCQELLKKAECPAAGRFRKKELYASEFFRGLLLRL